MNLLTVHQVMERIGFSKSWIYSAIRAGRFPKPAISEGNAKGTGGKNLWTSQQIDEWIAEVVAKGSTK